MIDVKKIKFKVEEKIEKSEVVDYEIKVDKDINHNEKSQNLDSNTFTSLTNDLW